MCACIRYFLCVYVHECKFKCLDLLSFSKVHASAQQIVCKCVCMCVCGKSRSDRPQINGCNTAARLNIFFERIFKGRSCQNNSKSTWRARHRLFWYSFFSTLWLSIYIKSLSLNPSCVCFLSHCFLLSLLSLSYFPPLTSATFPLRSPPAPPLSQEMSLLTSSDRKYKHAYQWRCSRSFTLSHLENLRSPPKHDNTHTDTEQGREKEEYALHWEQQWKHRREMEKISTEGWKRDGLLIVCFGSPDCDICEMLHVLNFSKLLLYARFICSVCWFLVYTTNFKKCKCLSWCLKSLYFALASGWCLHCPENKIYLVFFPLV